MRLGFWKRSGVVALVTTLFLVGIGVTKPSFGDEPGLFGRIFRMGGENDSSGSMARSAPRSSHSQDGQSMNGRLYTSPIGHPGPNDSEGLGIGSAMGSGTGSSLGNGSAGPRLIPQPRVNRSATDADPLLTRISIGRSDDGTKFGMFLQVFADGTVIDSNGVHKADPRSMKALNEAIRSADGHRRQGHCGGPPTDFLEHSHIVVYEKNLGRLKANSFSYSGNPQGCDPGVHQLHGVIETFQAQLLGAASAEVYESEGFEKTPGLEPAAPASTIPLGTTTEPVAPAPPPPFVPGTGAVVPAPGPGGL